MTRPTPEYLIEVMTQCATEPGFQRLRREGYTMSRSQYRDERTRLIGESRIKQRRVWSAESTEQARQLAAEGKTARQIAKATGTSPKQVYDLLHRLGVAMKLGRAPINRSLPDRDRLAELYAGNTMAKVASIMGVPAKVVSRWIKAHGLEREAPVKVQRHIARPRLERRKLGLAFASAPVPPPTETGPLADAARYLRQQGYANVYRRGRDEWQVGSRPMSEQDMLARVDEMKARRLRLAGSAA